MYQNNLYNKNLSEKYNKIIVPLVIVIIFTTIFIVYNKNRYTPYYPKNDAKIYLYGENHGDDKILKKEYEIWKDFYDNEGMRHLFVEIPYYSVQYLNIWMKAEDDKILMELYEDIDGTLTHVPEVLEFYKSIKKNCPETIFHGTDVGHQYETTGERYLNNLESIGAVDSKEYKLAQKNIEQGKQYYQDENEVYRENAMTRNFIYQYDKISEVNIMGIYGDAHTDPRNQNFTKEVDSMAKQLKTYYGDVIQYESIIEIVK